MNTQYCKCSIRSASQSISVQHVKRYKGYKIARSRGYQHADMTTAGTTGARCTRTPFATIKKFNRSTYMHTAFSHTSVHVNMLQITSTHTHTASEGFCRRIRRMWSEPGGSAPKWVGTTAAAAGQRAGRRRGGHSRRSAALCKAGRPCGRNSRNQCRSSTAVGRNQLV